jgi:pilus assembly protein CpaE
MSGTLSPSPEQIPDDSLRAARLPLIAYARDRETLTVLEDALSAALGPSADFRLGGIAEARAGLQQLDTPVAALVIDISGQAEPLAALEELALYVEPGVRVFVIGDIEDLSFYRQVTRGLGVQEYLYKPLNREILARTFLPAMTGGGSAPSRSGRIIAVTGVRGGVGATTLAVNLAAQLAEQARHHILLFDADLHGGTAALMLNGTAGGGLRAALENPGRVDVLFAERSSPAITDRLRLLAAEEQLDTLITVPEGAARHLTSLLCHRYNFVLIDLPRVATPLNHELRDVAHLRVLVMDATLPSLRDALRHLSLPRGPQQASRPIVVLNRVGAPGSLTQKQIVEGLDGNVDVVIPWLPKQLQVAATLGQPAVRRRGPFQAAIASLADEILPRRGERAKAWGGLRRLLRA